MIRQNRHSFMRPPARPAAARAGRGPTVSLTRIPFHRKYCTSGRGAARPRPARAGASREEGATLMRPLLAAVAWALIPMAACAPPAAPPAKPPAAPPTAAASSVGATAVPPSAPAAARPATTLKLATLRPAADAGI